MAYAEGDSVNYKGMTMPATIISGPHKTHGAQRWLIRKADDTVTLARETELSAIKDRRTLVAEALFASLADSGHWKSFDSLTSYAKSRYFSAADKVMAALDADAPKAPLAAGDRIRILKHGLAFAEVAQGDVMKVLRVEGASFHAETSNLRRGYYVFALEDEGFGWERA